MGVRRLRAQGHPTICGSFRRVIYTIYIYVYIYILDYSHIYMFVDPGSRFHTSLRARTNSWQHLHAEPLNKQTQIREIQPLRHRSFSFAKRNVATLSCSIYPFVSFFIQPRCQHISLDPTAAHAAIGLWLQRWHV